MKEKYETPKMEVVKFEVEDIIRTSGDSFYDDTLESDEVMPAPLSNR